MRVKNEEPCMIDVENSVLALCQSQWYTILQMGPWVCGCFRVYELNEKSSGRKTP